MPLVRQSDFVASAKSDPSKSVAQLVRLRTHDESRPMPAAGKLPDADLAPLDAWLDAGAPPSSETCSAASADAGAGTVGPQALTCPEDKRVTFRAFGDGAGGGYVVPPNAGNGGNLYRLFTWKSPFRETTQGTEFAPIIDDARVIHHWILFETDTPQPEGQSMPNAMPTDARFVTGWAPGGTNRVMPPSVGLRMPAGEKWFILQVHYWNVAGYTDVADKSGVSFCYVQGKDLRPNTAAVATLGTISINVPPRSTGTDASGTCVPRITTPLTVISSAPHMHQFGTRIRTNILRGGDPARVDALVDVPRWDFEDQRSYDSSLQLFAGDKLTTTCTYDNPTDQRLRFGERTEDEMCLNFVTTYPPLEAANGLARACMFGNCGGTTGMGRASRCVRPSA
jgi:hypothetical protein